ncbi:MAG TPA: GNAT family N-acetyltransferase [Deltaproteobacteria bacterium]|nr:GNAT family N-acetyltransferase [Deltaproteobacteria bacterium]
MVQVLEKMTEPGAASARQDVPMLKPERSCLDDFPEWIRLAGEVEPLFGPMVNDPSFREGLKQAISEGRAVCARKHEDARALLGGIIVSPEDNEILWFAVSQESRGRGTGKALLAEAVSLLDRTRPMQVITFAPSEQEGLPARTLFQAFGFVDSHPGGPNPAGIPTSVMVRPPDLSRIRPCTREDVQVLARTIRDSFRDVAIRFGLTPENCPRHPSNCTEEWITLALDQGAAYFLLEHEGAPAGCVALETGEPGVCYLERLAVLPACRRRGFGRELVSRVLDEARASGARRVNIGVIAAHTELKDWYRGLGFVEGESRDFPHLPFRVAFMSRDIG